MRASPGISRSTATPPGNEYLTRRAMSDGSRTTKRPPRRSISGVRPSSKPSSVKASPRLSGVYSLKRQVGFIIVPIIGTEETILGDEVNQMVTISDCKSVFQRQISKLMHRNHAERSAGDRKARSRARINERATLPRLSRLSLGQLPNLSAMDGSSVRRALKHHGFRSKRGLSGPSSGARMTDRMRTIQFQANAHSLSLSCKKTNSVSS